MDFGDPSVTAELPSGNRVTFAATARSLLIIFELPASVKENLSSFPASGAAVDQGTPRLIDLFFP
jgi:hypothetical protein